MLSPLGPALCEEKRGEGKKESDVPFREAFYGFPSAFILFNKKKKLTIFNTCPISSWFQWAQCFKLAQKLDILLSLWRNSNETEWPQTAGFTLSKMYPQIYFLECAIALRFYITLSSPFLHHTVNATLFMHKMSFTSWPYSSSSSI